MLKHFLLASLMLLTCWGITAKQKVPELPPAWIANPYSAYPMNLYLCGIGVARDFPKAQKEAIRAIAEFFETEVKAATKTEENVNERSSSQSSTHSIANSFASLIETKTQANIKFGQVVESWEDPRTKNLYVLIVVDKSKARAYYAQTIQESEQAIEHYLSKQSDPLKRFANIYKAIEKSQQTADAFLYHNALADNPADYLHPQYSLSFLQELRSTAMSEIPFQIVTFGDKTGDFTATLRKTLQDLGLSYADSSLFRIEILIDTSEPEMLLKQYYQSCSLTITMLYNNTPFFSFRDQTKQGGMNLQESENRNFKVLCSSIKNKFSKELLLYLNSL